MSIINILLLKVRQHLTGPVSHSSNLEYGIGSIYSNLLSLDSQIKILFNDVNHDIIANQYSFCGIREHKKDIFSLLFLREHSSLSFQ